MSSIVSQIDSIEERIQKYEARLESIDVSLRRDILTESNREELCTEKDQLNCAVVEHQKTLQSLRHENRRTMMVSVAIMVLVGIIFMVFYRE